MSVAATANSGAASGGAWVTVGEYANGHEADLAVALLAGHGISASLENREFVGMDWGVAAAVGWIKVNVPEASADAARETLGKMERAGDGADLKLGSAAITDVEACLRCGGKMPVENAVCAACGWSYAGNDETLSQPIEDKIDSRSARAGSSRWLLIGLGITLVCLVLFAVATGNGGLHWNNLMTSNGWGGTWWPF